MHILLPFALALLAIKFSKQIRTNSTMIIILTVIVTAVTVAFPEHILFNLIKTGTLGLSFLIIVMFTGAFANGSKIKKQLRGVRRVYSILGFILVSPHALLYIYEAITKVTPLEINGLLAYLLIIPLSITSFNLIRRKLRTSQWIKIHRFAYLAYILIFIHLMMMSTTIDKAMYLVIFSLYIYLKLYNHAYKKHKMIRASLSVIGLISASIIIFSDYEEVVYEPYDILQGSEFKDGTYTGESIGYRNIDVEVTVTIVDNTIKNITLIECGCTPNSDNGKYLDAAYSMTNNIVLYNDTSIDSISGATLTTRSITNAVIDALEKAKK